MAGASGGPAEGELQADLLSHEFTDEEIQKLLAGEEITFDAVSKQDKPYVATGSLGLNTFKGRVYVGFVRKMPDKPTQWCSHTFTDDEVTALLAGQKLKIDDFVSARTKKTFSAEVTWDADQHKIIPDFGNPDAPPKSWCNHEFTDAEYKKLVAGQKVKASDFVSSKTKKRFEATVQWKEEKGRKKLVPSFGK